MRTILATLGGLIVGVIIIMGIEMASHIVFPPPEGVDFKDPEQLKTIMASAPLGAKLAVLLAWGLGVFGGGAAGVLMSGRKKIPATIIAFLLLIATGLNLFLIPHPNWMIAGAVVAIVLGWYGATRFARQDGFPVDNFS